MKYHEPARQGRSASEKGKPSETGSKPRTVDSRSHIDLEFCEDVSLSVIKEPGCEFSPEGDGGATAGRLLMVTPISALLETECPTTEGALLGLSVSLETSLDRMDVLGVVKRVDRDDGAQIVGVEFVERDQLADVLSGAELDLLDRRFGSLRDHIARALKTSSVGPSTNGKRAQQSNGKVFG